MFHPEFWTWLLNFVTPMGLLLAAGYLARDAIGQYLTKGIEHRFEKKLEIIKSDARDNEKELEQMRSFVVSARKDRDAAFRAKRFEAAETMMRAVQSIAKLSMAVEYMKILNIESIMETGDEKNTIDLINLIAVPIDIDNKLNEINSIDLTVARLFLDERTLRFFDAYRAVFIGAATMMKIMGIPLKNKGNFFKKDGLSDMITKIIPSSKSGFESLGDRYAYYLAVELHAEVLRALRSEVSGIDDASRDFEFAEQSALISRQARANIEEILKNQDIISNSSSQKILKD